MENYLLDAYDLHIHCAPDVVERSVTGLEMTKIACECGMRGFAFKAHYGSTASQAAMLRAMYPECNALGGITLNSAVGGINPMAVENAARLGAKIVWCPTFDSPGQLKYYLENHPQYMVLHTSLMDRGVDISSHKIIDEDGKLTKAMSDVLDIVRDYGMMLGTGHISHEETFALARESKRRGYKKLVITHADWNFTYYSLDEQMALAQMGATIEHSYTSPAEGAVAWETVFEQIRKVGVENTILSTDLGQKRNVYPNVGFQRFACKLAENGFSRDELRSMMVYKPAMLVEE